MPIIWPTKLLKPQEISVDIAPRSLRSPTASNGFGQVVSNSAGMWRAVFSRIPVYTNSMIRAWRGIANQAEGQLNPIVIPIWDFPRSPLYNDTCNAYPGVPHSDGSPFSDGSLYASTLTEFRTEGVSSGVTVTVNKEVPATLEPGHRFSVRLLVAGEYRYNTYEINRIVSQDDTTAQFIVRPPLRNSIPDDTRLEFDFPVLQVKLATDNEMFLPLDLNRRSFPSVNFYEDV